MYKRIVFSLLLAVSLLISSPGAYAAIAYVQSNNGPSQSAAGSLTATYTSAQTAGDLNVVAIGWVDATSTVTSVVDSSGNTYVLALGPTTVSGTTASQSIYYAQNIVAAAAGTNTVTVTFNNPNTPWPDVRILEYSGIATANALDGTPVGASSATGTALSSGSLTTTNANDLLIGSNFVAFGTTGAGSGYTQRILSNGNTEEDEIVTSTGTYSATSTQNPSGWWIQQLAAFKASGSGPTAPATLSATTLSSSQINLSWTASTGGVGGVSGYRVERCSGAGCSSFAQVGSSTTAGYADTGLSASTNYSYRVRASDTVGDLSGYSNTSTAITSGGTAAITYVQSSNGPSQSSAASLTATYTSAQTAGDLNVIAVGWLDTTSSVTVADSKGNTYVRALGPTTVSGTASQSVYYAQNIAAAAAGTNAVTVTFSNTTNSNIVPWPDVRILEYSGIVTANALDGVPVGASSTTGTALSSGSLTTTNANDLLIGSNFVAFGTTGAGSGFTQRILSNGNTEEDEVVTSTGSYSATSTQNPSGWWIQQLTAFKGAVGTPPPSTPTTLAATATSSSQINLSWTASTDTGGPGLAGYQVWRCSGAGCSSFAQVGTPTTNAFSDTGLAASTSYTYEVRAIDTGGLLSAYSATSTATTGSGSGSSSGGSSSGGSSSSGSSSGGSSSGSSGGSSSGGGACATGGTSTYTYDPTSGRLTSVTNSGGCTVTYHYDGNGNVTSVQ